jgi:O-antigen ligase
VHAVKDSLHDLPMAGRDWFRWLSTPKAGRLALMTFAVLLMGLSLLLSGSQSAMAGLAAGSIAFGALIFRREQTTRMRLVACGSFLAAGLALAVWAGPTLVARRVTSVATDASTVGGGREAWGDTLNIIRNFSATGTGLNTYGTAMIQYQSRRDLPRFQEAHNEYLQLAAEGGLLLGIPILLTIAVFLRSVWKRFHEAPHSGTTYWLRVGAVIGLVSIAFQSIFEFSLQMPANALLFALLAAIALHRSPNLIRSGSKRFEAAAAAVAAVEDGSDDSDVTIPVRAKLPARRSHVIVPPRP